jgi:hypothetical protein
VIAEKGAFDVCGRGAGGFDAFVEQGMKSFCCEGISFTLYVVSRVIG